MLPVVMNTKLQVTVELVIVHPPSGQVVMSMGLTIFTRWKNPRQRILVTI